MCLGDAKQAIPKATVPPFPQVPAYSFHFVAVGLRKFLAKLERCVPKARAQADSCSKGPLSSRSGTATLHGRSRRGENRNDAFDLAETTLL